MQDFILLAVLLVLFLAVVLFTRYLKQTCQNSHLPSII